MFFLLIASLDKIHHNTTIYHIYLFCANDMSAAKKPETGLCFPIDTKGGRSTTDAGKNVLAAAFRGAGAEGERFAVAVEKERNFRFKYQKHYMNLVRLACSNPETSLKIAKAGSEYMHANFNFVDPKSKVEEPFAQYMSQFKEKGSFHIGQIRGTGAKGGSPLTVPYKNGMLSGEKLKDQLRKWMQYGTIESDAAAAISAIAEGKLDLSGQHFVLIGAGSAMGPFYKLLEHGASVVCIDIPGMWGERPQGMWKRLLDAAKASPGEILVPLNKPQSECASEAELLQSVGCNLTEQPAQILNFLLDVAPGKPLTVGNYTYLDGDLHVKLSLAADSIIKHLCESRAGTSVAFLCTPTDIHVINDASHAAALQNYGMHPGRLLEALIHALSFGKFLQKNALKPVPTSDGGSLKIVDGLSVAQGPNYALAKRLQHWRAQLAFERGNVVSSNVAPSTATLSVVSNKSFGWAYGGMPYFKPYEIFHQDTTNAMMASLLIADISRSAESAANPANRKKFNIKNTLEIFKFNSVHGGVWRAAYKVDSIGETSVLIHFLGGPKYFLCVVALLLAALVFAVLKVTGRA